MIKNQWTKRKIIQEAKNYLFITEFELYVPEAFRLAKQRGYLDEVCSHMQVYKPRFTKQGTPLTKESIIKEANKYKTKWEFKIKSPGAYQKANELKIMNECFASTFGHNKNKTRWTHELIIDEAKNIVA